MAEKHPQVLPAKDKESGGIMDAVVRGRGLLNTGENVYLRFPGRRAR